MGWVLRQLGPEAIVYPGQQQHARAAIQWLSGRIPQERIFIHLGWRKHGPDWVYLHAGDAVGAQGSRGDLRVELPAALQHFQVPSPAVRQEQVSAVRASLRCLDLAPDRISFPLLAKNMPTTHSLQPWTYHCLFGLLAVTGLRISEALNLRSTDVDWSEGILTIRNSKFGKSRLIPLQASSLKILSDYGARRDLLFAKRKTPYFFCSRYDGRLDEGQVRRVFYMISRQIGIRGAWPATDRVCTTFVIVSQSKRCCAGIAPGKMSGGVYPSYPPISVTDMSPTPTGT
jgi:hypothetical protein